MDYFEMRRGKWRKLKLMHYLYEIRLLTQQKKILLNGTSMVNIKAVII